MLTGTIHWDPLWSATPPLLIEVSTPTAEQRSALWRECLGGQLAPELNLGCRDGPVRALPEQVAQVARAARSPQPPAPGDRGAGDLYASDATLRRGLWDRCLGRRIPRAADLDLDFCAGAFELSGGNICSAIVSAAYLGQERPVGPHGRPGAGVYQEYRKLGRLTPETEFGKYFAQLRLPLAPS